MTPTPEDRIESLLRQTFLSREHLADELADVLARPGPEPARRPLRYRGHLVLAAASVVVVLLAVGAIALGLGSRSNPTRPATPAKSSDPSVVSRADRVPSVFGYDGASARAMLESRGLVVTEQTSTSCEVQGRALDTQPKAGSLVGAERQVVLRVSGPSELPCLRDAEGRELAWQFLDFANGRGPAPAFADNVALYVDDAEVVDISGADQQSTTEWDALFGAVRENTERLTMSSPSATAEFYAIPVLDVWQHAATPTMGCGYTTPVALVGRPTVTAQFSLRTQALYVACDVQVDLFRDSNGEIDAVVVSTKTADDRMTVAESVIGQTYADANRGLREGGFDVAPSTTDGAPCGPTQIVTSQSPSDNVAVRFGAVITLTC